MNYAKKLAKRVLARNPRSIADSHQILTEVLEKEGYTNPDDIAFATLRIDVANAARKILLQRKAVEERKVS